MMLQSSRFIAHYLYTHEQQGFTMKRLCYGLIIAIACGLVGCEAMMFGMPESQFNSLSPNEKKAVIASYNKRKEIEKKNEPLNALVGVLGSSVSKKKTVTKTKGPVCHWEGKTKVCKKSSTSTSFGFN